MRAPKRGIQRAAALLTIGALVTMGASCSDVTGPGCDTSADMRYNDVPTYLDDGSRVATFHFSQRYQSAFNGRCASGGGRIALTVTSNARVTQTFSFTARGIDPRGVVRWSTGGTVVRLTPGATEDEGVITDSDRPVDEAIRIDLQTWSSP